MRRCRLRSRLGREDKGAVASEFAIIMPIFLLLVAGIIDFGHAWYMKQMITMASRDGARYGAKYNPDGLPSSTEIQNFVINNYANMLPSDANLSVTANAPGASGQTRTVTVNAIKNWFVLSALVPGLGSNANLSASTTMLIE